MSILCVTTSFHARFSPATQGIEVVNVLAVCDKWVTHIAITPWETTEQGQCQSFFSYIEVNVDNHSRRIISDIRNSRWLDRRCQA